MKRKDGYLKQNFFGASYLIPYGQNIVEHKKSFVVNESSEFLLDLICEDLTFEEIVSAFLDRYDISSEEIEPLREDLKKFISKLERKGIVKGSEKSISIQNKQLENFYKIGPLYVEIDGEKKLIHDSFEKFSVKKANPNIKINLFCFQPNEHINGTVFIRTDEVIIMDTGNGYVFLFPMQKEISELHVSKDGSVATLFYNYCSSSDDIKEAIYHAMRFAFLVAAQNKDLFVVHSASILYRDKAWLFSGSSGTGKSTHTALWHELCNTPFINGDLNMIGIKDGKALVYGLPWCGTSGIYTNEEYELGGIIFLKQNSKDIVQYPTKAESVIMLLQRIITPLWTSEMLEKSVDLAKSFVQLTDIFKLYCTKDISAAEVMKEAIDERLEHTKK